MIDPSSRSGYEEFQAADMHDMRSLDISFSYALRSLSIAWRNADLNWLLVAKDGQERGVILCHFI